MRVDGLRHLLNRQICFSGKIVGIYSWGTANGRRGTDLNLRSLSTCGLQPHCFGRLHTHRYSVPYRIRTCVRRVAAGYLASRSKGQMEPAIGIEPISPPWRGGILPLKYAGIKNHTSRECVSPAYFRRFTLLSRNHQ